MKSRKEQSGAVLIISLVVVIVLSLIVTGAVQSTVLQQKMSNNLRDKDLAFQAAETSLKSGEAYLYSQHRNSLAGIFDGTNGLYTFSTAANNARTNLDNESNWSDLSTVQSHTLSQVKSRPTYIIEELPEIVAQGDSLTVPRPISATYYRVTSKSKGGTDASLVILQSIYKKL
ncbi:MAG: PilX N-terminal domain-containing pilus assembly protein [Thiotrichaceae bacterium]